MSAELTEGVGRLLTSPSRGRSGARGQPQPPPLEGEMSAELTEGVGRLLTSPLKGETWARGQPQPISP